MTNKTRLSKLALSAAFALTSFSTFAFAASFPKTPQEFSGKTTDQMKSYNDVKVTLNKPLDPSSFKGKTETELSLMRNSIYAQAGFKFSEPWLKNYFASRAWYKEGAFSPKMLTKVDFENVKKIYEFQKTNNLLTSFTPAAKPVAHKMPPVTTRKTASSPDALKLKDKDLRAALMKMRYCTYTVEGNPYYKMTFHHNNVVTLQFNEDKSNGGGAYGDAYEDKSVGGDAYGAGEAEGDAYGDAYDGGIVKSGAPKSTWRIKGDQIIVNILGGQDQYVYLTKTGLKKHICN